MKSLALKFFIAGAAAVFLSVAPASAQIVCPVGYYYSDGYGCVPDSEGYGDLYGDPAFGDEPPYYDSFGLVYGYGGGRGGHGHGGGGHGGGHGGGGHGGGHGPH